MDIIDYFIDRIDDQIHLQYKGYNALRAKELIDGELSKQIEPFYYRIRWDSAVCLDTKGRIIVVDFEQSRMIRETHELSFLYAAIPYSFRFIKNKKGEWRILF